MAKRICFSALILISVLFFPFWVSILFVLLGMFYFSNYWEAVVLCFVSDLLFGIPEARFFNISLVATAGSLIALFLIKLLKKKLKFYQER